MRNQSLSLFSLLGFFAFTNPGKAQDCNNNGIPDEQEINQENYLFDRVDVYNTVALTDQMIVGDIKFDHAGNIITCGRFKGSVDFNPGEGTDIRTSSAPSSFDLFITKTSADGSYLWTRTIGGNAQTVPNGLAIDSQNQIVICGFIKNLSNLSQGFVRKFNTSNGSNVWNLLLGNFAQGFAEPKSVVVDATDNVFIAGEFNGAIDFDPSGGTDIHDALSGDSTASKDAFLSKFSPTGIYSWTRQIGEEGSASGINLAIDSADDLILIGRFAGTVDFDPDPVSEDVTTADNNSFAAFISKLNPEGLYLWGHRYTDFDTDVLFDRVSVDSNRRIYLAFHFDGSMDFDPSEEGVDIHTSFTNASDIALSSFLPDGSYSWTKNIQSTGNQYIYDLAVDAQENLFLLGFFSIPTDFDPGKETDIRISNGAEDVFLAHYTAEGSYLGALTFGGSQGDSPLAMDLENDGTILLTGRFRQTVDFDPNTGEALRTAPSLFGNSFTGLYELVPPAADQNENGVPDVCETGIVDSIPAHNRVDARQPFPIQGGNAQGMQSFQFFFAFQAENLTAQDFLVSELGGDGIAPAISNFSHPTANSVQIILQTPLEPETWTSFTHLPSATNVRFGYLPADANGDGNASAVDILALIDSLNGVTPRPIESTDIDRSGVANPADILRLIDLLNGAGPYDPYLGHSLP